MAERLLPPLEQVITDAGEVATGYKLKTYATGTVTPLATYSNEGLSIANANPATGATTGNQIVDADGYFGDIWVDNASSYKAVLTDENDVTIKTINPMNGAPLNSLLDFDPMPAAFWGTTAGTSSAYTLDADPDISTIGYSQTQTFFIAFHTACAASPTIAINGLTALSIKKYTGAGTKVALQVGDVQTQRYLCTNDGTDIIVLNPEYPYLNGNNITQSSSRVTISNNGSDASNDIDFSAGRFQFSDGTGFAILSAITKRLDASWAAGTNQGGLDTGSETTSTWYYAYAIYNPTSNIADAIFSINATTPTLPSGYTKYKRVGAFYNSSGSVILPFNQLGNKFLLQSMVQEYTLAPAATVKTEVTTTRVPPNMLGIYSFLVTGVGTNLFYVRGFNPSAADATPDETNAQLAIEGAGAGDQVSATAYLEILTNSSSQISYRASAASAGVFYVRTQGWIDYSL